MNFGLGILRSADFSPCRTWRYTLIREWNRDLPRLLFVLLNPSTADERRDDPTNRRCLGFARRWGFGSLVFVNLFAIRSSNPKIILEAEDPVGPENDRYIIEEVSRADLVVAAWGASPYIGTRDSDVLGLLPSIVFCLGMTRSGAPRHPLYLPNDTDLVRWKVPA